MIVTIEFKYYITELIKSNIFPNLNNEQLNIILNLLYNVINFIAYRFNFDSDINKYIYQLKQNNNRDLLAIFNLLFPFIDDKG